MKTGLTIVIGLLACFFGCERVDDPSDIPFVERLVVKGDIFWGNPVSIVVERTVPVSEQYSTADTRLIDVTGAIVSNGVSHPIFHQSNGEYRCDLSLSPGQNVVMYLDWHGKKVTASTSMPYPAHIDTVITMVDSSAHPWVLSFDCIVTPRPTEAYAVFWSGRSDSTSFSSDDEFALARSQDASNDGKLHFAKQYPLVRDRVDSLFFYIRSYDMPYYDFFASQGNPDFGNVPLITYFTGPVRWNVRGDGVGLFVARNYVTKTVRLLR
jgi:hypothetical protein